MKNVKDYFDQGLIDFIRNLWVTDEFKHAYDDPTSEIYEITREAAKAPLFFYEMSDPLERTQFSSWWRHIQLRKYDIPAVSDLYYLHELTHISSMVTHADRFFYDDNTGDYHWRTWEEWLDLVIENEFDASMMSEVFIYFDYPSLREQTFKFPIWADRFIGMDKPIDELKALACKERKRIFTHPDFNDEIEMSIHKYNTQNVVWAKFWENKYHEINEAVARFKKIPEMPKKTHKMQTSLWFQDFIKRNTTDGVVFKHETELFHHYTKNSIITIFKG